LWTIYDQYQTKIFEVPYKKGVRDGTATWFYPNQAKMREVTFKQGLIDGEIIDFDEAEKVVKRRLFADGRPIVRNTTFYRPSVKKTEEYFLGKKLEPEDADDWWEAKPTPYLATGSETQNGAAMAWYENGQPKKRGQFKDGKPVGQFTWWHANGSKQSEGFYIDGQKSRRWTWWYENGMKQVEGIFQDDQPIAIWRAWHADGELRKEKDYSDESETTAVETSADPSETSDKQPVTENPGVIVPDQVNQKPTEQSSEPGLNAPTTEDLPLPAKANSGDGEPGELETIDPLEFRTPTTPGDPPAENKPVSEDDEIGTIEAELFEGRGDPHSTDGKPAEPKKKDKST
jgi:antitoxin component YwqK of YwqJK toxin-antitoxin module